MTSRRPHWDDVILTAVMAALPEGVGEDAIARVHHLADLTDYDKGYNAALGEIRRALNCCPTCSGPIRETVGLVCQTCGTDYGDSDE